MNRKAFYAAVRVAPFGRALKPAQVAGMEAVLDEWESRGWSDLRWLAYMLATDFHETARTMQAVREIGRGKGKKYGKPVDGKVYYGRGLVQLTWADNYAKMGEILGVDLHGNPDLALRLDIAVQIMFEGMARGTFTGKKLSTYFAGSKCDWRNARRIINGTDCASQIANYAKAFHRALLKAEESRQAEEPTAPEVKPADKPEPIARTELEEAADAVPEPKPRKKSLWRSKIAWLGGALGIGGGADTIGSINEHASNVVTLKQNADELGVWDVAVNTAMSALSSARFWMAACFLTAAGLVVYFRWRDYGRGAKEDE